MICLVKCYTVICDNCGIDVNHDTDFVGFPDKEDALYLAEECDWIEYKRKHYCPQCYIHDENGKVVILKEKKDTCV